MTTETIIEEIQSAVLIGAGNVAWHLGSKLAKTGVRILQVYNRSVDRGRSCADSLNAVFTNRIEDIVQNADLYLIALSDDAIEEFANSCKFRKNGIVLHCAGAVGLEVLNRASANTGVFYPLQTFTKERSVSFDHIPVFIEASNTYTLDLLRRLAGKITSQVYEATAEDRLFLHLSAVLSANFSNHLLTLSEQILADKESSLQILKELMLETINKAFDIGPGNAQTGPAIRGNQKVMEKHLLLLKNYPDIDEIYKTLSNSIIKWNVNTHERSE